MRRRPTAAIALIVAVLACAGYWHARQARPPAPLRVAQAALPRPAADTPERAARTAAAPMLDANSPREDSLRGTQVDGALRVDDGRPLADRELRRMFDYFLTRLGERDAAAIRADLAAHLRDALRLDAAAQAQALAWFDAYVEVERAAGQLPRSGDLVRDAAQLRDFRHARLGDELARAWYGAEEDYAAHTAERLAVLHDTNLGAADKAQRLSELESRLDPVERDSRMAATEFQIAAAQSRQFDAQALDAVQRHSERTALWGEEAATRLGALDQAEAEWSARVLAYTRARDALLANGTIGGRAREAQLAALLDGFSETEQRRLLSLAQANALPRR